MSSGTPYIGSKISLVSKAEIRYEGFLYTIDQNDSTVTLAKVISLGTEDRVPDNPVPAREEVFEYIVFRGSDIKDLHVCEGPKRVEDPAIVHQSSHSYSQNNNPYYPRNYAPFAGGMPNFGYHPFNFHQNGPADIPGGRQRTPPSLPRTPTPEPPKLSRDDRSQHKNQISNYQDGGNRKIRVNESKYKDDYYSRDNQDSSNIKMSKDNRNDYNDTRDNRIINRNKDGRDKGIRDNRDKDVDGRENRARKENRDTKDSTESKTYKDGRYNREKDNRDNRNVKDSRDNNSSNYRDYRNSRYKQNFARKEYSNNEEREDGRRGPQRSRGRGRSSNGRGSSRNGNNRTKFTEDFDFETANAKFNKEEIEKELLKVLKKVKIRDENGEGSELQDVMEEKEVDERAPLPSPDKYYDRSKSFFDNISCEAMVPKSDDEIMTRRQEQALNTETFGSSASHFRPGYRGRGRGRGRWRGRGRGSYRGRGNYRGNSNRPWVDYEFDYEAAGIKNRHQPMKVSVAGS